MRLLLMMLGLSASLLACSTQDQAGGGIGLQSSNPSATVGPQGVPLLVLRDAHRDLPDGWQPWVLHPSKARTLYRVVRDPQMGFVIAADADASASGLMRELRLDLTHAPLLEWQWRVTSLVEGADNTDQFAEDAPVRLVLAFDGDRETLPIRDRLFFERARLLTGREMPYATLMYIWENRQPVGSVIKNPHTERVRKYVVASGAEGVGRWHHYRRNVIEDFTAAYGKPPGDLIGVAILTDSDNTRQRASAQYGHVRLVPTALTPVTGDTRAQVP